MTVAQVHGKVSLPHTAGTRTLGQMLREQPLGALGALVLVTMTLLAIGAPFFAPFDPWFGLSVSVECAAGMGAVLGKPLEKRHAVDLASACGGVAPDGADCAHDTLGHAGGVGRRLHPNRPCQRPLGVVGGDASRPSQWHAAGRDLDWV